MVNEQKINFITDALANQRNMALDSLAGCEAELRLARIKIAELEEKLNELAKHSD